MTPMRQADIEDQMGNVSRTVETLRNSPKETLGIEHSVTAMKTVVDGLIHRPDMAEEMVSELADRQWNFPN